MNQADMILNVSYIDNLIKQSFQSGVQSCHKTAQTIDFQKTWDFRSCLELSLGLSVVAVIIFAEQKFVLSALVDCFLPQHARADRATTK